MKQLKQMKELCIGVGLSMSVSSLMIYSSMKPGLVFDNEPPSTPEKMVDKYKTADKKEERPFHRKSMYVFAGNTIKNKNR